MKKISLKENIDKQFREIKTIMSLFKLILDGNDYKNPKINIQEKLVKIYEMLYITINNSNIILKKLINQNENLENIKNEFLNNINLEIRSPLRLLKEDISGLSKISEDNLSYSKVQSSIESIEKNYAYLELFLIEILNFHQKITIKDIITELSKIDIVYLISYLLDHYHSIVQNNDIHIQFKNLEKNLSIICDYSHLKKILDILLQNILPHIEKTTFEIKTILISPKIQLILNISQFDFTHSRMFLFLDQKKNLELYCKKNFKAECLELYTIKKLLHLHGGAISFEKKKENLVIKIDLPIKSKKMKL